MQAADSRSTAMRFGLQFILLYTMMPLHGCLAFFIVATALTTRGSKNTLLHMAAFGGHARMVRPALPSIALMRQLQRRVKGTMLFVCLQHFAQVDALITLRADVQAINAECVHF